MFGHVYGPFFPFAMCWLFNSPTFAPICISDLGEFK